MNTIKKYRKQDRQKLKKQESEFFGRFFLEVEELSTSWYCGIAEDGCKYVLLSAKILF